MKFNDAVLLKVGFVLARNDENVRDPRPIVFARRLYTSAMLDTKVSVDLEQDGTVVELAIEKLSIPSTGTKIVLLRPSEREFILAMMSRNQDAMVEELIQQSRPIVLH